MRKIIFVFLTLFFLLGVEKSSAQRAGRDVKWVNPEIKEMVGLSHCVLKSAAMGFDVGYVVWTPEGYSQNTGKRYPVIYFLHGMGGNETSDAAAFSGFVSKAIQDKLLPPVICVFPNGGVSGYRGEVEKMIIDELIPTIDKEYRTIAKGQSRAVTGFSMGGSGSIYFSVMHPGLFCVAGSMGGGFRANEELLKAVENAILVWKNSNYAFCLVNGDNDRPEAFKEFAAILDKHGIENKVMIIADTGHDLGKYYIESSGQFFGIVKAHILTE